MTQCHDAVRDDAIVRSTHACVSSHLAPLGCESRARRASSQQVELPGNAAQTGHAHTGSRRWPTLPTAHAAQVSPRDAEDDCGLATPFVALGKPSGPLPCDYVRGAARARGEGGGMHPSLAAWVPLISDQRQRPPSTPRPSKRVLRHRPPGAGRRRPVQLPRTLASGWPASRRARAGPRGGLPAGRSAPGPAAAPLTCRGREPWRKRSGQWWWAWGCLLWPQLHFSGPPCPSCPPCLSGLPCPSRPPCS